MKLVKYLLITSIVVFTGCATIMGDNKQNVTITSEPGNASFKITDEKGTEIKAGKLPETLSLDKSDGTYFGGKTYSVEISMTGYEKKTVTIKATPNGWFVGGNIIFGGLIGWLVVDPLSGAMYNLTPNEIKADLQKNTSQTDIHVVLLKDVPEEFHAKMNRLN